MTVLSIAPAQDRLHADLQWIPWIPYHVHISSNTWAFFILLSTIVIVTPTTTKIKVDTCDFGPGCNITVSTIVIGIKISVKVSVEVSVDVSFEVSVESSSEARFGCVFILIV